MIQTNINLERKLIIGEDKMKQLGLFTLSLVFLSMPAFADNNNEQYVANNSSYETVKITKVDRTGKPPFKRTIETIRVTDIAALEWEESRNTSVNSNERSAFQYKLRH